MKRAFFVCLILAAKSPVHSQWTASLWQPLEQYVDGVTNTPPQYEATQLIEELRQATLERLDALGIVGGIYGTLAATNAYGPTETLGDIDFALERRLAQRFMLTNGFNSSGEWILRYFDDNLTDLISYELLNCPPSTNRYLTVTNSILTRQSGLTLSNDTFVANIGLWINQTGVGDTWPYVNSFGNITYETRFQETKNLTDSIALYEAIYTITNATTLTNGAVEYTTGWIFQDHADLSKILISTNNFTGSNGWVEAKINLASVNNYNTTTQDLPSITFTVTGDAFLDNWYQPENRFYGDGQKKHLTALTNQITIAGGHGDEIAAGVPWVNIFANGVSTNSGLTTQTSTNIADFTHLGDSITWYWVNTNLNPSALYNSLGPTYAYKDPHALVGRKRLISAMRATYEDLLNIYTLADGYKAWRSVDVSGGNYSDSFLQALSDLASDTPYTNSTTSFNAPFIFKYMMVKYDCGDAVDDPWWYANAYSRAMRFGITNKTTNTSFSIDFYATDTSGDAFSDWYDTLWTEYDSDLTGHSRTSTWRIATYDNITTGHGAWTFGSTDFPSNVSRSPTVGDIKDQLGQGDANTFRGYKTYINEAILRWNFAYQ